MGVSTRESQGTMHLLVCLTVIAVCVQVMDSANMPDSDAPPYVKTQFYQTSVDQWNNIEEETKQILSSRATQYCQRDPEECGMKPATEKPSDRNFTKSDVLVQDGYPEQDRSYLNVPLAMQLPEKSGQGGNMYLKEPAMKEIIKSSVEDIRSRTGKQLVYIDEEFTHLPPDNNLNAIIIPIACVILIVLIILAIIVRIRLTKKEHKEEAEKVAKKTSKPVELLEVKRHTDPSSSGERAAAGDVKVEIKPDDDAANNTESAALLDGAGHAGTAKA